jgi:hypothetical protein
VRRHCTTLALAVDVRVDLGHRAGDKVVIDNGLTDRCARDVDHSGSRHPEQK